MRIIKEKTLKNYCEQSRYRVAASAIRAWAYEVRYSDWNNSAELKVKYKSATIISSKRVVFNIKGNKFRLVVDVEYNLKIVFVVWFGTHVEYDKIDVNKIQSKKGCECFDRLCSPCSFCSYNRGNNLYMVAKLRACRSIELP